ncbi:MAG TPA: hypothetical protein VM142_12380 [Acidimicrobiales bacterium]|nr:hypothetical protein [Acidimicrobiales bacterium]
MGPLSVVLAAAVAMAFTSAAFACTVNMRGAITFSATAGGSTITSASSGSTVYSSASNLLSANATYVIRYVPLANRDDLCHNSPLALPRTFTTNGSGAWSAQAVDLPPVRGTYSMCAATPAANEPALDNPLLVSVANWSDHVSFTIT